MYIVGEEEIEAITRVIRAGQAVPLRRRGPVRDLREALRRLPRRQVTSRSRPAAPTRSRRAMTAMGIGPGDEVIIPAHTYMATATAVLAVGAIPVIVDVDESITIDRRRRFEAAIGPHTRAIVPVHMWGAACDMDAIMEHRPASTTSSFIEDACQGVGGGYKGRKLGSIGHVGAFSFNYYKNMTSGEGGGVAVNDDEARRAGPLRHRPLRLLLAGQERRRAAVLRQRRAGVRADGRDAERAARPHRRHDRHDAGREAARSSTARAH